MQMDLVKIIREGQRKKAERTRAGNRAFCLLCKRTTTLLDFWQAADLYATTRGEIMNRVEMGEIHRVHNSRGEILLCRNSMLEFADEWQKTQPMRLEFLQSMAQAASAASSQL